MVFASAVHRHRQVLLLRYYAGLKFREIAARLNLPIGNVQARLYAARSQMIRLLRWDPRFEALGKELRDQFPPLMESRELVQMSRDANPTI